MKSCAAGIVLLGLGMAVVAFFANNITSGLQQIAASANQPTLPGKYDAAVERSFLDGCTASAPSGALVAAHYAQGCRCMLDRFEQRFTQRQFIRFGYRVAMHPHGKFAQNTPLLRRAAVKCL